jgi:hypothetical protein
MAIYTPDRYPLHDTGDVNSANLPTAYSLQGFPAFSIADPRATNALLQANGGWTQYNDFTLVRAIDTHNSATAYRLSLNLGYATGAGLESLSPTTNPVYVFRGNVIRFRDSFLMDQGLDPITFTASMRTWIYCDANGAVRIDIVALATAATPATGEFTVIAVDTDATDITAIVTTSSPAFELHFTGPNYIVDTNLAVLGDSVFVGTVDVTGTVTLGAGGLDMNTASISNADNIGCETLVANTSIDTGTLEAAGTITANGSVLVNGTMSVVGAVAGVLTSDPTAVCTWNGTMTVNGVLTSAFRTKITSTTSLAANDMSVDGSSNLRWRDATATKFVNVNASGWVKGYGQSATLGAAAASLTLDTANAVAPLTTADLDVEASCWVSRALAGTVTVSLDEVGVGQIGTSSTYLVPATGGSAYATITFSRTKTSASTTPKTYRLTVAGGGSNVTVINARITVTPTS